MRLRSTVAAGWVSLALLAAGCGRMPGYPAGKYVPPDQVKNFRTLYNTNCRACHGPGGENGPAIDLANPEYQALVDDASLRNIIAKGMPGTQMPAWAQSAGGMLTDAQVDAIVAGMRKEWQKPNAFEGTTPPPLVQPAIPDAKTRAAAVKQGRQLYQAHCASCHTGPARQQLTSPIYLALISDQALRSIIIAGRPDIGQPDWRHDNGQLSPQDVTNIVAYLGSLRNSITISAPAVPLSSRR
ncbi:MAG TPA: cytochrome c [Acidobacteriaceae bacterium]|nr:cytochrome c [Acidobacteriaceae bacterium]